MNYFTTIDDFRSYLWIINSKLILFQRSKLITRWPTIDTFIGAGNDNSVLIMGSCRSSKFYKLMIDWGSLSMNDVYLKKEGRVYW